MPRIRIVILLLIMSLLNLNLFANETGTSSKNISVLRATPSINPGPSKEVLELLKKSKKSSQAAVKRLRDYNKLRKEHLKKRNE